VSTLSMAALVLGGALITSRTISENVPHSQGNSSELMSALTDTISGLLHGYERSCTSRNALGAPALCMRPRGEEWKGLMRALKWDLENGPVYLPAVCSWFMYLSMKLGLACEEEWFGGVYVCSIFDVIPR
jgi:hypothetical protein